LLCTPGDAACGSQQKGTALADHANDSPDPGCSFRRQILHDRDLARPARRSARRRKQDGLALWLLTINDDDLPELSAVIDWEYGPCRGGGSFLLLS
jgi:hypothetical protein